MFITAFLYEIAYGLLNIFFQPKGWGMGAFRYSTGICSTLMRAACCLPTTLTITTTHHQHYFENIHEAVLLSVISDAGLCSQTFLAPKSPKHPHC